MFIDNPICSATTAIENNDYEESKDLMSPLYMAFSSKVKENTKCSDYSYT